jgi:GNAT superfamily N-acetyltransferase
MAAEEPLTEDQALAKIAAQMLWVSSTLDDCAALIRDIELNHGENVRKIGKVLAELFDIEAQVWEKRPDLLPLYLRKEYGQGTKPRAEVTVRAATAADEDAVLTLIEELFEAPGAPPANYSRERGLEGFRHAVEESGADVLLALDGASVLGLASVYLDPPFIRYGRRCWLEDLVITSSRRSEGIGALLIDAATAWARERGCTHLELSSGAGRVDAHRFYREQGMAQSMLFSRRLEL